MNPGRVGSLRQFLKKITEMKCGPRYGVLVFCVCKQFIFRGPTVEDRRSLEMRVARELRRLPGRIFKTVVVAVDENNHILIGRTLHGGHKLDIERIALER